MDNEQLAIWIKAGIDVSENMLELYKQIVNAFRTNCNRKPTDLEFRAIMHISDKNTSVHKENR